MERGGWREGGGREKGAEERREKAGFLRPVSAHGHAPCSPGPSEGRLPPGCPAQPSSPTSCTPVGRALASNWTAALAPVARPASCLVLQ